MTFPYKIGVDRCIGSCNDKDNPYFKVCLPDSVKNISVKSLDLIYSGAVNLNAPHSPPVCSMFNVIAQYVTCHVNDVSVIMITPTSKFCAIS